MSRIAFKDFLAAKRPSGMLDYPESDPFDTAVDAANAWIEQHAIQVLNVETVLLPGIDGPQGTLQTVCRAGMPLYQFVRVWYRPEPVRLSVGAFEAADAERIPS